MAANKFKIDKRHTEHAAKVDPDVATVLPPVGYIVYVFGDSNAKDNAYEVDGFKITVLTELVQGSLAPFDLKSKRAFMLIGTDFSKHPAASAFQEAMKKKGKSKEAMLFALVATDIHHEAIHTRIAIDVAKGDRNKMTMLAQEYFFTALHFFRQTEGTDLLTAIIELARHTGQAEKPATAFAGVEFEKFLQEKFAFRRVNKLTPDFDVKNPHIIENYFKRFIKTLETTAQPNLTRMLGNSIFVRRYTELKNTAEKALTTFYDAYDKTPGT